MHTITYFYFLFGIVLIPAILIKGSYITFTEAKLAVLLSIAGLCSLDLLVLSFKKNKEIKICFYHFLFLFYLIFRILMLFPLINFGLQIQSIFTEIAYLLVCIWVYNSNIKIKHIIVSLLPSIVICLVSSIAFIYFRLVFFSSYSPFGGTIGLKNSLSVYLSSTMPFLLVALDKSNTLKFKFIIFFRMSIYILLIGIFSVVILNRTRSAWLMISFILIFLTVSCFKRHFFSFKILRDFIICGLISLVIALSIPNTLRWKSNTPYADSLASITDFTQSSGRDELWKVALKIIADNPLFGIGTGKYQVLWQDYISTSLVNPKTFAFIRPDLNLFNDYLQSIVENGVFIGSIFTFLFFVYPIFFLIKFKIPSQEWLLLSIIFSISLDAFFDYPFRRPETIFLLGICVGLVLKRLFPPLHINQISLKTSLTLFSISSLVLSFVIFMATFYKRDFSINNNPNTLAKAIKAWPWSFSWNSQTITTLIDSDKFNLAKTLSQSRAKYWPKDPESYLMLALIAKHEKDLQGAENLFKQSLTYTNNGRCFFPAHTAYYRFLKEFNYTPKVDTSSKLEACR